MGLFSKLKALLGAKENQITPEENDSSKETSDELDESMLVDDYGNFHRHDFSSKEEFENDGFSHVEYFTRRDQLTYILQHCRYTWSDEVMKKCHIYFLQACLASVAKSSSIFLHQNEKTIAAYEIEKNAFQESFADLYLAIFAAVCISNFINKNRKGEEIPSYMQMPDEPEKLAFDYGLFIGMQRYAKEYIEAESQKRESFSKDLEHMENNPDIYLVFTLGRLHNLFEDVEDKGLIDGKFVFTQKEYEFAEHHFYRVAYMLTLVHLNAETLNMTDR
jgi:hypothetical protein